MSSGESEGQDIRLGLGYQSLGYQGSLQRCLPFWFVSFCSFLFVSVLSCLFVCSPARPPTVYKRFVFLELEKELTVGMFDKQKKDKKCFHRKTI